MGVTVREKYQGSGVWWVFISHKGKKTSKRVGPNRDTADDVAEKIRAKLLLNEFDIETDVGRDIPLFGIGI